MPLFEVEPCQTTTDTTVVDSQLTYENPPSKEEYATTFAIDQMIGMMMSVMLLMMVMSMFTSIIKAFKRRKQ